MTLLPHPYAEQAALELAHRDLAVFRIEPWSRIAEIGWQKTATTDPDRIRSLFAHGGNIGVACRASRIVVLDLDRHPGGPDGVAGWDALCARHEQTPPTTFTVATPNGGLHVYFQAPGGATITSSSGQRPGLPAGIDVRAPGRRSGGYVLGPGSQTQAGRYRVARNAPLLDLPGWLATALAAAPPARPRGCRGKAPRTNPGFRHSVIPTSSRRGPHRPRP